MGGGVGGDDAVCLTIGLLGLFSVVSILGLLMEVVGWVTGRNVQQSRFQTNDSRQ